MARGVCATNRKVTHLVWASWSNAAIRHENIDDIRVYGRNGKKGLLEENTRTGLLDMGLLRIISGNSKFTKVLESEHGNLKEIEYFIR